MILWLNHDCVSKLGKVLQSEIREEAGAGVVGPYTPSRRIRYRCGQPLDNKQFRNWLDLVDNPTYVHMSCEQSKEQIDLCENKTKYWIKRSEWGGVEATVVSEHSHGLPTSQVHDNIISLLFLSLSFFLSFLLSAPLIISLVSVFMCTYQNIESYHFSLLSKNEIQVSWY